MADLVLLQQVKDNTLSIEEAARQLRAFYLAERRTLTYKVSEKHAISFYGIRKIPITLYRGELDQVRGVVNTGAFKQFLVTNRAQLSFKDPAKAELLEAEPVDPSDPVTALLDSFKNGNISMEVLQQHLNEQKTVTYKVSTKGAISFYGIRGIPITLYKEELDRIMETIDTDEFKQFLVDHASELSTKPVKEEKKELKSKVTKSGPSVPKSAPKSKQPVKLNMIN